MTERDRALDAFRNCITEPKCKDCPWTECSTLNNGSVEIPRDLALAVMREFVAQEPRVMGFDEVISGDECWLEAVNGACGYADCYACTGTGEVQIFRCKYDNPQYITASDYLKTWRCWTSRPTDEQREAVKWE